MVYARGYKSISILPMSIRAWIALVMVGPGLMCCGVYWLAKRHYCNWGGVPLRPGDVCNVRGEPKTYEQMVSDQTHSAILALVVGSLVTTGYVVAWSVHRRRRSRSQDQHPDAAPLLAPPGWYPDPADARAWRYWDGARWTSTPQPR